MRLVDTTNVVTNAGQNESGVFYDADSDYNNPLVPLYAFDKSKGSYIPFWPTSPDWRSLYLTGRHTSAPFYLAQMTTPPVAAGQIKGEVSTTLADGTVVSVMEYLTPQQLADTKKYGPWVLGGLGLLLLLRGR